MGDAAALFRGRDLKFLQRCSPSDREMSIWNDVQRGKTEVSMGSACAHRRKNALQIKNCNVKARAEPVCLHTHLVGNRPSGADLFVATMLPTRKVSGILTPRGVYFYRATPELKARLRRQSRQEQMVQKEKWRQLGFRHQEATQAGTTTAYLRALEREGFDVAYRTWADIAPESTVLIQMTSTSQ